MDLNNIFEARKRRRGRRPELPVKPFQPPKEVPEYEVIITKRATKDLKKIPDKNKRAILGAIKNLENLLPKRPPNWETYVSRANMGAGGKIRVGIYRVLTDIDDNAKVATIARVSKRGSAKYDSLDRELDHVLFEEEETFTINEAIKQLGIDV